MGFDQLPSDVLLIIFSCLPARGLARVIPRVCKRWRAIAPRAAAPPQLPRMRHVRFLGPSSMLFTCGEVKPTTDAPSLTPPPLAQSASTSISAPPSPSPKAATAPAPLPPSVSKLAATPSSGPRRRRHRPHAPAIAPAAPTPPPPLPHTSPLSAPPASLPTQLVANVRSLELNVLIHSTCTCDQLTALSGLTHLSLPMPSKECARTLAHITQRASVDTLTSLHIFCQALPQFTHLTRLSSLSLGSADLQTLNLDALAPLYSRLTRLDLFTPVRAPVDWRAVDAHFPHLQRLRLLAVDKGAQHAIAENFVPRAPRLRHLSLCVPGTEVFPALFPFITELSIRNTIYEASRLGAALALLPRLRALHCSLVQGFEEALLPCAPRLEVLSGPTMQAEAWEHLPHFTALRSLSVTVFAPPPPPPAASAALPYLTDLSLHDRGTDGDRLSVLVACITHAHRWAPALRYLAVHTRRLATSEREDQVVTELAARLEAGGVETLTITGCGEGALSKSLNWLEVRLDSAGAALDSYRGQ